VKGIIFNVVEEAVTEMYSADVWDDLLNAANLDGSYTAIENYDDAELLALVGAAVEATGIGPAELVPILGRTSFKYLSGRYPEFLEGVDGLFDFLKSVDTIIHPEVMKLHPRATPPRFGCERVSDDRLRVTYKSNRCLGALAVGLVQGAADHFCEPVEIQVVSGGGEAVTVLDVCRVTVAT